MKKLIMLLCIATSISLLASNPNNSLPVNIKITKEIYILTPQPIDPANRPLECCRKINYGYDISGCYSIGIECWGDCGNHGYMVSICPGGGVEIRGARMVAGNNGNINNNNSDVKLKLPLTIGLIDLKTYDPNQDIISQLISFEKKKNSVITFDNDIKIESEEYTMIIQKGDYQIENSKLLVIVN